MNKTKSYIKSIAIIFFVITSTANADTNTTILETLNKQELEYLKSHPVIIAHNETSWPPFNFNENGEPKGFSIDYMNLIAQKIGVKVKYISGYSWDEFVQLLKGKDLDLILNMSITDERKKSFAFSEPFVNAKNAIYVNMNGRSFSTLDELKGKKVALVNGFFVQNYITRHYPDIDQVLVPDLVDALEMLSQGKVDAVVGKQIVVDYILRENLIPSVMAVDYIKPQDTVSKIAIATKKKDQILIDIIKKAQSAIGSAEMTNLKHKWFGINALLNTKELLSKSEKDYLKSKKIIKVCIESSNYPIEFRSGNAVDGIVADIMDMFMGRLNVQMQYIYTDTKKSSISKLKKGTCDMIPVITKTNYMADYAYFTSPYLEFKTALITKKDKPNILQLNKIQKKLIAGSKGNPVIEKLMKTHPRLVPYRTESRSESLNSILSDKAYLSVMPVPVFKYFQKEKRYRDLKIAGVSPVKAEWSIAVRKSEPTLFNILEKIIKATPKSAPRAISNRWFKGSVIKETDYTFITEILAVALLVIGIISFAYRKQQKLNKEIEKLNETLEERIEKALEENRKQQALMLHQDRLARMGEMIAMIAHQWRQPLNNLSLINQTLVNKYKKRKLDDNEIENFRSNSQKQIKHMSETIDDFRNFYKPTKTKTTFCVQDAVREIVEQTLPMFVNNEIEVAITTDGCSNYYGYLTELQHAVLNIVNNARDALLEQDISDKNIKIDVSQSTDAIIIKIIDNAGGIPDEIRDKIFEPYFSTKENKNGTGLGLYITKVIIVDHMRSIIDIQNIDNGTEFTIILKGVKNG